MASSFTWLDHRPDDTQRIREALSALEQPGTLDPLGFGVVRDGFSEMLFPGLSTVMTRARYFLFVPWIFQKLDREGANRPNLGARARELEIRLIHSLLDGSDHHAGIIGQNSRDNTKQLPSIIYWGGLGRLGIRRTSGSRTDYFSTTQTRLAPQERSNAAWHTSLPRPPEGWLDSTTLAMARGEADFLRDRILNSANQTFLAVMARDATSTVNEHLPWDSLLTDGARGLVKEQLHHARLFSTASWGAGLIYNFELARLRALDNNLDVWDTASLDDDFALWVQWVQEISDELAAWDRPAMWALLRNDAAAGSTRRFVDWWIDQVITTRGDEIDTPEVRRMLRSRETAIKGTRAKLSSKHARETSKGASGEALMTFRWPTARSVISDIVEAGS